jgi:hypothetical protein
MANHSFPGMGFRSPRAYNDTILTITRETTPDPYVLFDRGTYYMVCIPWALWALDGSCILIILALLCCASTIAFSFL